ncbi:type II toxin-antitoxin system RelE family toxin [Lacticaseibacillus sharpeae]|uniref:type II toxin-antitoxin system RelE family toxin n=1 Tax=Lacticaseibacillus sharpeae TaxID=1626 RepID=UPI0006D0432F|nr:hypothetical protein [Lacticaseibacillus sharpeae]
MTSVELFPFSLQFFPEVAEDLAALDHSQIILIDKGFLKLKHQGWNIGKPLVGDLVGFNELKYRKAGLRIIFRRQRNSLQVVEVVVAGRRKDSEVFRLANYRIHNTNEDNLVDERDLDMK